MEQHRPRDLLNSHLQDKGGANNYDLSNRQQIIGDIRSTLANCTWENI